MNIYYSIQNGGDGSAYPMFLSTSKLARWDQDHMDEGWGESCDGNLTILADNDVVVAEMMDEVGYWLDRTEDEDYELWEYRDEFLSEFFPNGLPQFEVRIREGEPYYDIYVGGDKKGERFAYNDDTRQVEATEAGRVMLEKRLNAPVG